MQTKTEFPSGLLIMPIFVMAFLLLTALGSDFVFHPHGGLIISFPAWVFALAYLVVGFVRGGRILRENPEANTRFNRVALYLGGLVLLGNLVLILYIGVEASRSSQ